MMLFLELAVLLVLFLLFRLLVKQVFPKRERISELSPESIKALRKFQFKQGLSTIILTILLATLWVLIFIAAAEWLLPLFFPDHILIGIQHNAFMQPALVLGLSNAIWLSPKLIKLWNKDGLDFFYHELEDTLGGYKSSKFQVFQIVFGIILSLIMLYGQLNTFILLKEDSVFWQKGLQYNQEKSRNEVLHLSMEKDLLMIFKGGDTLSFGGYHYQKPVVEEWYEKGRP